MPCIRPDHAAHIGSEFECPYCHTVGFISDGPCCDGLPRDDEPQGDTVRLFEPAPAQIPGQLTL